jgi:hypothetical protein
MNAPPIVATAASPATTRAAEFEPVEVVADELSADSISAAPRRAFVWRLLGWLDSAWEWLFGAVALVVGLSIVATIPVVQLLSLGYLLEASGRVARTGRVRNGFVGVRKAARVGSIALGAWLLLWPVRLAHSFWVSARLIDPASPAARGWGIALAVMSIYVAWHVLAACARGGRLRHFLWPRPLRLLRRAFRAGALAEVRDGLWNYIAGLRLGYYFWLGLRGFAGGLAWLALPVALLAAGRNYPLLGFIGGALLMFVVTLLPFLQTEMAAQDRLRAMFAPREIRATFRRAPLAFLLALAITLASAVPLYLLKIELVPREAAWLPSLLFVTFIFPARLLCGWAVSRAGRRDRPRHWFWRLAARGAIVPLAAAYVLIIYFTQYLSWHGVASLYEQHAFLLPVPFLGG